jgi:hypothetical protein
METLHERLHKLMNEFPRWRREMQGRIKELGPRDACASPSPTSSRN